MSQLILVGKSEARRAYSQDFWGLEEAVGDSDTWFLPVRRAFPGPRENRRSGGALYYQIRYWGS